MPNNFDLTRDRVLVRAFYERAGGKNGGNPGDPIRFKASTEGVKRDGLNLDPQLWNLENYRKNPVFLWVHDYRGNYLPLGRAETRLDGSTLMAEVTFDQSDDFARQVEAKYRNGFLYAVSVGWRDVYRCKNCKTQLNWWQTYGLEHYRKQCPNCEVELTREGIDLEYDLLDISGVPVPGDPDALIEREFRALGEILGEMAGDDENGNEGGSGAVGEEPVGSGSLDEAEPGLSDEERALASILVRLQILEV